MDKYEKIKKEYEEKFNIEFDIYCAGCSNVDEAIKFIEECIKENKPQKIRKDVLY